MSTPARLLLLLTIACALAAVLPLAPARGDDFGPLLEKLRAVGPEGRGHREAARAWAELVERADAGQLPAILAGLDGANPLAANWVRAAADAVAERALKRDGKLPGETLAAFVQDTDRSPRGRQLAFEWLRRSDAQAAGALIPGLLDDPSLALRREAVRRLTGDAIQVLERSGASEAVPLFRRALDAARDLDQVTELAKRLRDLGQQVDLARHFGFLTRWKVIGPFDNTGERGFDVAYPPEKELDFDAEYDGKHGRVKWFDFTSDHDYGRVDFHEALAEEKGVVAYAATEFLSDQEREVEFRLSSFNAVKLWLNGRLVDEHNVYHSGSQFDQYVSRATLRPGRNVILVKTCQNEQTQSWARKWYFQLRVCDEIGTAILSTDRPPSEKGV